MNERARYRGTTLPLSEWSLSLVRLWNDVDRVRAARNLSFREVASMAGVQASTFTRMKDLRAPSAVNFMRICSWLECNPSVYFGPPPAPRERGR